MRQRIKTSLCHLGQKNPQSIFSLNTLFMFWKSQSRAIEREKERVPPFVCVLKKIARLGY